MSWSYSSSLEKRKDQVRFLLQDIDSGRQQLQDEEILWLLGTEANVYMAAAAAADLLVARSRGISSQSIDGLSKSFAPDHWKAVATRMRARGGTHQTISAGGVSLADRDAMRTDDDLIKGDFFEDLHRDKDVLPADRSNLSEEELP